MSVWQILFGFKGRLNRKPYWIAGIGLMVAAMFVAMVVGGIVYFSTKPITQQEFLRAAFPWLTPFTLIFAYPLAATLSKRLRDRNKPGSLAALFIAPVLIESWLDPQGWTGGLGNSFVYMVYAGAVVMTWVVGIWFFVELGFMRGSVGENKYGPDPLAAIMREGLGGGD